jgi:hypothetical protein
MIRRRCVWRFSKVLLNDRIFLLLQPTARLGVGERLKSLNYAIMVGGHLEPCARGCSVEGPPCLL